MQKLFSGKSLWFIILFAILGLGAMQVPLTQLVGSKVHFTLFDTFAPIAGSFIGTIPGIMAVALMELVNFFMHGAKVMDVGSIIALFPMLFAAMYFAKKTKLNLIVPLLCILAFNLNPIGRSAWYYSLYWLIPVACYFIQEKSLIASALGATFTAHAVGGAAWVWAFGLSKAAWTALIPIVAMERAVFTVGICLTYLVFNNVLNFLVQKKVLNWGFLVNPKYVWKLAN